MSFELSMEPADFLEKWLQKNWLEPSLQEVFDRYYSSYRRSFGPYMKEQYNNRLTEVLGIIKSRRNPVVLDIGSGCGTESLYFSLIGCRVLGIELDSDRFEVALGRKSILEGMIKKPVDCEFVRASIIDLNISKTFDLIWMDEAFHHLEPRNRIITMLSRLVKPSGYIVITESNALNPLIQLSLFKKRGFKTRTTYVDGGGTKHSYGNERILRASKMKKLFEKEGISCISIRYLRVFPNLNINNKMMKGVDNLIPNFLKPLFVHYNYVGIR